MKKDILVEVCCGSIDDAIQAETGGADRIELNSSLFLGGLTPSIGTVIEVKKKLDIPVMVMIRPRSGGFNYSSAELEVMEQDIKMVIDNGTDGIVFGILKENGTIDKERCKRLIKAAGDSELVFHRAFDVTPDPYKAVDDLIELGFNRILTSGQKSTTVAGINLLRDLIKYATGRIEILPGGGIRDYNVEDIVNKIGCDQIHITSFTKQIDNSTTNNSSIFFGAALYPPENVYKVIDSEGVKEMKKKVNK